MKPSTSNLSCEDVLNAFAMEPKHERSTLERYLQQFPQYAVELAHLSHEISHAPAKPSKLTEKDRAAIDEAWRQYSSSSSPSPVNLFASLSVPELRELAQALNVPRQIVAALRDQRVIVQSIPHRFLANMAAALKKSLNEVMASLTVPSDLSFANSHKADEKPVKGAPVTFEQLLIEAQVPADKRAELMSEGK